MQNLRNASLQSPHFVTLNEAAMPVPCHNLPVIMSSAFATTVAVVVPVILLAVGAEAREFEKRTRGRRGSAIQEVAETFLMALKSFPRFESGLSIDEHNKRIESAVKELKPLVASLLPDKYRDDFSTLTLEQAMKKAGMKLLRRIVTHLALSAVGAAWLAATTLLIVAEGLNISWLGQRAPGPEPGVAEFSLWITMISLAMLFATPAIRLLLTGAWPTSALWISPITIFALAREARVKRLPLDYEGAKVGALEIDADGESSGAATGDENQQSQA